MIHCPKGSIGPNVQPLLAQNSRTARQTPWCLWEGSSCQSSPAMIRAFSLEDRELGERVLVPMRGVEVHPVEIAVGECRQDLDVVSDVEVARRRRGTGLFICSPRGEPAELGVRAPVRKPLSVEGPPPIDQVQLLRSRDSHDVTGELPAKHADLGAYRALGQLLQESPPARPADGGADRVLEHGNTLWPGLISASEHRNELGKLRACPPRRCSTVTTRPQQPLVSVCLPVLNQRDLVGEAIDSALDQDYSNIEIVVVDDGSTDGTPEVLRRRYGDRIRLLLNPARAGQARATSRCIRHSHGALVKFLDHDDTLSPHCVSRLVEALLRYPSAGMAFGRRHVLSILTLPADVPGSRGSARCTQDSARWGR